MELHNNTLSHILMLFTVLLLQLSKGAWAWVDYGPLVPPLGNSLHIEAKSQNGSHVYECRVGGGGGGGAWTLVSAEATLVLRGGGGSVVGRYYWHDGHHDAGTWELVNSPGDAAESGFSFSLVSGKQISMVPKKSKEGYNVLPEFLARASRHKYLGEASGISYIARLNTVGGVMLLPTTVQNKNKCQEGTSVVVPFEADFNLYQQDRLPPRLPAKLVLPSTERPVEGLFAKGVVSYVWEGKQWRLRNVVAKLYDIPGGAQVGGYRGNHMSTHEWYLDNPYGFIIKGREIAQSSISTASLPWSLSRVTSSSGNISMLGPFTSVHMISTSGGVPLVQSGSGNGNGIQSRDLSKQPFTAVFWLYTNS